MEVPLSGVYTCTDTSLNLTATPRVCPVFTSRVCPRISSTFAHKRRLALKPNNHLLAKEEEEGGRKTLAYQAWKTESRKKAASSLVGIAEDAESEAEASRQDARGTFAAGDREQREREFLTRSDR